MSVSKWAWTENCEGKLCVGDCDLCDMKDEENVMDKQKVFEWLDKLIDAFEVMRSSIKFGAKWYEEASCLNTYSCEQITIYHPDALAKAIGLPYRTTREKHYDRVEFWYKGYMFSGITYKAKKYKYTLEEAQNIALLK